MKEYLILYIPDADVTAFIAANKAKFSANDGLSVWDLRSIEYFEKTHCVYSPEEALAEAKRLLPLDHFREIHVYEREPEIEDDHVGWNTVRHTYLDDTTESFKWENCED